MEWIRDIALFMVFSGIILEIISDTKYCKYAKWVAGMLLLLQFIKPLTSTGKIGEQLFSRLLSFDYALGTDRVLDEIYEIDGITKGSVLTAYKTKIAEQVDALLRENGLRLIASEINVAENGTLQDLYVFAVYMDKQETTDIFVPTVAPVLIGEAAKNDIVSPMELYIREMLGEFYRLDVNNIEVVIQEA